MTQQTFLSDDVTSHTNPHIQARARKTDPATSHEAAAKHEASGNAVSHRNILANYVKEHPGTTNGEAARDLPELGYQEITRRMGEVAKIGLIRRGEQRICSVNKSSMTTWWPV